jgi:ElaB/YqjD/DUF883 family membrane-anchored ribosome-binding protein
MANNVDQEINQLKSDMAGLREDMASLVDTMKEAGMEKGRQYYDSAYERARHAGEAVSERAREAYSGFGKEVEDHPMASVLTAFGTGFVVGMLLDRRQHH